ncbi:hypothetical protein O181_070500 [Austropuccinia psidii MF-1]|uniref:Uncharacterized protein n=1 Tax=Austropuccinia psidii MF-1 TaxID=1389203 RepID=A0A9Q3I945_9BASI|nr:hypothetical protein [Austropuccinia psidii MF-1]
MFQWARPISCLGTRLCLSAKHAPCMFIACHMQHAVAQRVSRGRQFSRKVRSRSERGSPRATHPNQNNCGDCLELRLARKRIVRFDWRRLRGKDTIPSADLDAGAQTTLAKAN